MSLDETRFRRRVERPSRLVSCGSIPCSNSVTISKIQRLFLLVLFVMMTALVQAQFTYTTNDGTITITGYTGPGGAVTIPSALDGMPVTAIGYQAFSANNSITNLIIPSSVTSFDYQSFSWCNNLVSISIPSSVTNFGSFAFSNCHGLTNITIPSSMTTLSSE